jgi:hypothetical protein
MNLLCVVFKVELLQTGTVFLQRKMPCHKLPMDLHEGSDSTEGKITKGYKLSTVAFMCFLQFLSLVSTSRTDAERGACRLVSRPQTS